MAGLLEAADEGYGHVDVVCETSVASNGCCGWPRLPNGARRQKSNHFRPTMRRLSGSLTQTWPAVGSKAVLPEYIRRNGRGELKYRKGTRRMKKIVLSFKRVNILAQRERHIGCR